MHIKDLTARNFRNYSELHITFSPEINFIIGRNGVGKTNILEAISIASNIKTFRNIHDSEIIKWKEDAYYCSVTMGGGYDSLFEVGCIHVPNSVKKKLKIDGKEIKSASEYYGRLLTVILSPNDINIINGNPDTRRRFFDGAISKIDTSYFKILGDFKKILASRNSLLKHSRNSVHEKQQLDVWDIIFSEKASHLMKRRREFSENFTSIFQKHYADIAEDDEVPFIRYKGSCESENSDDIFKQLVKNRERDHIIRSTIIGPQRDDYIIENKDSVRFVNYASQGQRRTAAVTLKVSECVMIEEHTNKRAVILVDDIFSELDEKRRLKIIDILRRGNQIIFTMVHYEPEKLFRFGNYKGLVVNGNGAVTEIS
ncbi:MAG: DNA replication/repair protein RecF [Chrysiogenales bacterium]|nr:MAG: DNA replication/repair protein RecF [Chrysiogenales bacterium]